MSAPNFKPMKFDMPMVCGMTYHQMEKYVAENFDDVSGFFNNEDYYFYSQLFLDDANEAAEQFNEELKFHEIYVLAGYYDSFQFYVEEKYENYFDLDKNSEYCITNEDAHYYFDMTRSEALRKADSEKRKIEKWLNNIAKNDEYNKVSCVGVFSNGEAIYSI